MKTLTLITLALSLSACGHATTEMDRELALKLADRPTVIAAAPPVINVNNYIGAQSAPTQAAPWAPVEDNRTNCTDSPLYDNDGKLVSTKKICFGGQ